MGLELTIERYYQTHSHNIHFKMTELVIRFLRRRNVSLSGVLRREGDDRGWDGWMASPTQWTWIWVNSGSWWWTGRPGVLKSMGSHRVRHDWVTELNWTERSRIYCCYIIIGTGFKEKHILEQDESFCCVIISSGLKEKKKSFMWLRWRNVEKEFVIFSFSSASDPSLLLGDPRLLIKLPKN